MFAIETFILPNRIANCLNFHRRKIHTLFGRQALYFIVFKIMFGVSS